MKQKKNLVLSFLLCFGAYAAAFLGSWAVIMLLQGRIDPLLLTFLADAAATVVVFIFSTAVGNASMYDPYWSAAPIAMAFFWNSLSPNPYSAHNILILIAVCFWGVRLTLNWARGWEGLSHQDWRYSMLREKNPALFPLTNFFGIHLFPTLMVFLGLIPVYLSLTVRFQAMNILVILGFLISIGATVVEFIADEQMKRFRKQASSHEYIDSGLWRYSRHPNYFGECTFWWGFWVFLVGVNANMWWTLFGPLSITLMFLFVSIPMAEGRILEKRPLYTEYREKVSMLLPWIRRMK